MSDALEEADLRLGLLEGGAILGAFIVARSETTFVIYMRPNWHRGRGFRILQTWRGSSGERSFKNLDSAWRFIRRFYSSGRITVYPVGDAELRGFVGVKPEDLGETPAFS